MFSVVNWDIPTANMCNAKLPDIRLICDHSRCVWLLILWAKVKTIITAIGILVQYPFLIWAHSCCLQYCSYYSLISVLQLWFPIEANMPKKKWHILYYNTQCCLIKKWGTHRFWENSWILRNSPNWLAVWCIFFLEKMPHMLQSLFLKSVHVGKHCHDIGQLLSGHSSSKGVVLFSFVSSYIT